MHDIDALVRGRRSVRTFEEKPVSQQDLEQLRAFMAQIGNPYGLPVAFRLLDAKRQNLTCPVVVGTDLYVGAKMKKAPYLNEAVGYSFELLVLYAQSLGIGTVWIGGTMDRAAFESAMELAEDEAMPCVSPLGYPAKKMSLRETMMRKGVKADDRMAFESLFFRNSFDVPLTKAEAAKLAHPLEMVRLAPSAVNKQPWRVVVTDRAAHFYLKRSRSFGGGTLDMQKIDMGIALCHFDLAAKEAGLAPRFVQAAPGIVTKDGEEYIASYQL
ncbi:MAG: nitroreductase family protein [Clostridia bacterium]|nr:nitroreductase family protein [Clostridia bacterium]